MVYCRKDREVLYEALFRLLYSKSASLPFSRRRLSEPRGRGKPIEPKE